MYVAETSAMPNLLQELGRLREVTFRAAGEGTDERTDIDRFDFHYKHLLLWSKKKQELVGAYRMGLTAEILPFYVLMASTLVRSFATTNECLKILGQLWSWAVPSCAWNINVNMLPY